MGATRACRQSEGISDWLSGAWNSKDRAGASSTAVSFKNLAGILSGPEALFGLTFLSSLVIPSVEMTISSIMGDLEGPKFGTESNIGENTLENCLLRASAFSFGVVRCLPSDVSVDAPLLSVLVFLMNLKRVFLLSFESSEIRLARN